MDIQSKVAARRAELERQTHEARAESKRIQEEIERAKQKQNTDALDKLAAELSHEQVTVQRVGQKLSLSEVDLPELDYEGLRQGQLKSLLHREARKLWTPGENWQVIGCFVAGLCLIYVPIATILLWIVAWARSSDCNRRYRAVVKDRYPQVFEPYLTTAVQ